MTYKGANIAMYQPPDLDEAWSMLRDMRAQGADSVAFNVIQYVYVAPGTSVVSLPPKEWGGPRWWIYPDLRQDPDHPFGNYVPPETLRSCCLLALAAGFQRVMIKPMVDSYNAAWRGYISVQEHAGEFGWAYRHRFLSTYLPLLQEFPQIDLIFGTEMVQTTRELGPEFWIGIARWLRNRGLKNRIGYAANWGWWNPPEPSEYRALMPLWNSGLVNIAGVDLYAPMVPQDYRGPVTVDLLLNGGEQNIGWYRTQDGAQHWMTPLGEDLVDWATADIPWNVEAWATEIGYGQNEMAALDPAGDTPGSEPGIELALPLHQAARAFLEPLLDGILWWQAAKDSVGNPQSTHNILRSAELVRAVGGQAQ
jgi:hypothetical protein